MFLEFVKKPIIIAAGVGLGLVLIVLKKPPAVNTGQSDALTLAQLNAELQTHQSDNAASIAIANAQSQNASALVSAQTALGITSLQTGSQNHIADAQLLALLDTNRTQKDITQINATMSTTVALADINKQLSLGTQAIDSDTRVKAMSINAFTLADNNAFALGVYRNNTDFYLGKQQLSMQGDLMSHIADNQLQLEVARLNAEASVKSQSNVLDNQSQNTGVAGQNFREVVQGNTQTTISKNQTDAQKTAAYTQMASSIVGSVAKMYSFGV